MRRIYIGLTTWNLAILAAASLSAAIPGVSGRTHALAGLFAAVFACLTHSLLLIHFIGSMWWIRQEGRYAGLPDTKALRTAWVRGWTFPMVVVAAFLAVATGITGRGVETGSPGWWVHAALGVANLPVTFVVLRLAVRGIDRNDERMRRLEALVEVRESGGAVLAPPVEALRPESNRAGGKVLLWLSGNVWLLYAYLRLVLKREDPLWPFLVASAGLLALGLALLRRP